MIISIIRAALLYTFIILAIRIMGKRQISELQTSELVVTLLISDIAAIPMQDTAQPLVSGIVPIAVLVIAEIVVSALMVKHSGFRKAVCGSPIILINDGKVDQKQMRRLRITIEDLFEQLRQKDVFSLQDVAYAIMETNGKISVIKKPEKDTVSAEMLQLHVPDKGIETVIISDGEISDFSLKLCEKDTQWVYQILKQEHYELQDVFIMTANRSGEYKIIEKSERIRCMNRLWAAAGLLAVLITICTLAVISTQSITNSITQDIEQIADTSLQDDKDTALTLSRQAEEKWQNHHAVLCTFMSHMQLEEIDRSLAALPAFIELGEEADIQAECNRIIEMVQHLNEAELPYIQNIL